ncbi:MAG: SPFH domain-containing protein [Bacteroidota bacterium]
MNIESMLIVTAVAIGFVFLLIVSLVKRYKRCPSDSIMVVFGKIGKDDNAQARSSKCIHGGASFIWPVIQDYAFLDLTPISIEINLTNALSKQNIRVDVPSRFTVGVSTEPSIMNNAAERLLGLSQDDISNLAKDIIFGQLRLVVATMDIEEINNNRDKFLDAVSSNVEAELKKIGLKLINVNVTDINDESGYIEALGKEAAAKAINDAKHSVAEKNRDGEIGQAIAHQQQRVKVSDANADAKIGEAEADQKERIRVAASIAEAKIGEAEASQKERVQISGAVAQAKIGEAEAHKTERIQVAEANATAVDGENSSKVKVAVSDASRREREAEAERKAIAAEKVSRAKALEEAYKAEEEAEISRADKELATRKADVVVPAQIDKEKVTIDAEAIAEQKRAIAKGEADAIYAKMAAEGKGQYEILSKQAEGFEAIVRAAGNNPNDAVKIMIADKLPELVKAQVEAVKNLKIDKITVWDNMGSNGDSPTSAKFLSGMLGSVPPFEELFKMAGMELPEYLGKKEAGNVESELIEEVIDEN